VSATLLRELPYGDLERAARIRIAADLDDLAVSDVIDVTDRKRVAAMRTSLNAGRSSRRDDLFFAQLARDYVQELAPPRPTKNYVGSRRRPTPIKAVAAKRYLAPRTVQNALTEARHRELLTNPPEPGKPGGALTAKAKKLLREAPTNGGSK
jgi:hypothetical protein